MRPRRLNMYVFPLAMRTQLSSHESLAPVLADYTATVPSPAGRAPYPCDRARHLDHTRSAGVDEADSVRLLSIGQTQVIDVFCFAESQSPTLLYQPTPRDLDSGAHSYCLRSIWTEGSGRDPG